MKKLLFVSASLNGKQSRSSQVARELIESLEEEHGRLGIVERALGDGTIRHLSGEYLQAIAAAPIHRTPR